MDFMERREILKAFLDSGYQLDLKSLEFLEKNPNKISNLLEKLKPLNISTVTFDIIENLTKPVEFRILRDFSQKEKTYTVENFVKFFNNRYEQMKKLIIQKTNLVNLISINKISDKTKKFSLIGMVREKNLEDNSIIIEDGTGESKINFLEVNDFNFIVPDEVIGLVCEKQVDEIYVNKTIWPDIPLRKEIARSANEIYCLFISDFHFDSKEFKRNSYEKFLDWISKTDYRNFYIFILGDISSNKTEVKNFLDELPKQNIFFLKGEIDEVLDLENFLNNPSIIKIQDVTIFLSHGDIFSEYMKMWNLSPENIYLNLIKKRHLNPVFDFSKKIYDEDPYFLDIVPDIFVSGHFHSPGIMNYKGTTIISNGSFVTEPIFWLINLKTRETFKLDFT